MESHPIQTPDSWPLAIEEFIDPICQQFEEAWRHGPPPSLRPFLEQAPEEWRAALLAELLRLDVEYRTFQGDNAQLDAYLMAYPDLETPLRMAYRPTNPEPGSTTVPADFKPTSQEVPTTLGAFRIIRELGRGGMGIVYEAVQDSLGRHVALKVMSVRCRGPSELVRFRREAAVAGQLHHTNIVPVYEAGEDGGILYYAMQYIAGRNLHEVITAVLTGSSESPAAGPRVLTPRRIAEIGFQAASALAYAHDQGVIHRDIKPSNLLIDAHGLVWITDFGLVKTAESELTVSGDLLGTLRYMAPERLRGCCDRRTDLYALGLTLYEAITCQPAFPESDQATLLAAIVHRDPPLPKSSAEHVPRDLSTIILKAIHKEPERRYPSCKEFAEDLRRFLAGEPVSARAVSWPERLWLWSKRYPFQALGLAFFLFGLLVTTLSALWVAHQAKVHAADLEEALRAKGESERAARLAEFAALAETDEKTKALRRADGLRLVAQSELLRQDNPTLALLLAIEAAERVPGLMANNALQDALDECRERRIFRGHEGPVLSASWSENNARMVTASSDGTARIWDIATGESLHVLPVKNLIQAHMSADGRRVVTLAGPMEFRRFYPFAHLSPCLPWEHLGPRATLWDASTGQRIADWQPPTPRQPPVCAHAAGAVLSKNSHRVVSFFAYHPDGDALIHDLETGRFVARLTGAPAFMAIALSPDGTMVATASVDNKIRIWDTETGTLRRTMAGHTSCISSLIFSAQSDRLLSLSSLYHLQLIGERPLTSVATEDAPARQWEVSTGKELPPLVWPDSLRIPWLAGGHTVEGRYVLAAPLRGRRLWDSSTGASLNESWYLSPQIGGNITVPQAAMATVSLSPQGTAVLIAGLDRAAHLVTSTEVIHLRGHEGKVESACFAPDGRKAVTTSTDGTARLWELLPPSLPPMARPHSWSAALSTLSPDRSHLFVVRREYPPSLMIDLTQGSPLWSVDTFVRAVAFLEGGREVLVVIPQPGPTGEITRIDRIDITSGHQRATTPGPPGGVLAISPDGRRVLTTAEGLPAKGLSVWDLASRKKVSDLPASMSPLGKPRFSREGRQVLIVDPSQGPHVTLWDAEIGKERQNIRRAGPQFLSCQFLDKGRVLGFYGDTDTPYRVFDGLTETLQVTCTDQVRRSGRGADPGRSSFSMKQLTQVSSKGRFLVASPSPKTISLWDLEKGGEPWATLSGHDGEILHIEFCPNDQLIVSTSEDQTARIWEATTGRPLAICRGHVGSVTRGAFDPSGHQVVTFGNDRTVRLWNAHTGEEHARLRWPLGGIEDLTFASDGRHILIRSPDVAYLWDTHLLTAAKERLPRGLTPEEKQRYDISAVR